MCNCPVCQDFDRYTDLRTQMSESAAAFLDALYEDLAEAEFDLDYFRAVLDGSWPTAREVLDRYHQHTYSSERFTAPPTAPLAFDRTRLQLNDECAAYLTALVARHFEIRTALAQASNLVRNAVPDATARVATPLLEVAA